MCRDGMKAIQAMQDSMYSDSVLSMVTGLGRLFEWSTITHWYNMSYLQVRDS
jgi:hypothetical protein